MNPDSHSNNHPSIRFPEPLERLMAGADTLAKIHGIPTEAVLMQALAMASALAGHLVTLRPPGTPDIIQATFPLVILTPDIVMPEWIIDDWKTLQHLAATSDHADALFHSPAAVADQRRMNRTMDLLDPHRHHVGNWLAEALARPSQHKPFGQIHIASGPRDPAPERNQRPLTQVTGDLRLFRPLLRMLVKGPDVTGTTPPNHVAWLPKADLAKLARQEGPGVLGRRGTVIHCGAASPTVAAGTPVAQIAALVFRILSTAKFRDGRFSFKPSPPVHQNLETEVVKVRAILNHSPACLEELLVPEPRLSWHLSALLAAMCAGQDEEGSDHPAAVIGSMLATWAIRSHIVHIRRTFPADEDGFFEGRDRAIYRLLGPVPAPVRRFQRSRRAENKAECLQSLHRAVKAGLAVMNSAGHFALVKDLKVDLSDRCSDQTTQ